MISCLFTLLLFLTAANSSLLQDARTALERGDFIAAIQSYRSALQDDPQSNEARFGLSRALAFAGHYSESIDLFSDLIETNPNDMDSRLGRARALAWNHQYEDALIDILFVTEKKPDYSDGWQVLGDVYRWMERFSQAEDAYTRCLKLHPSNPEARLGRARIFLQQNRVEDARNDLQFAETTGGNPEEIQTLRNEIENTQETPIEIPPNDNEPLSPGKSWQFRYSTDYLDFSPTDSQWLTHRSSIRHQFTHGSITLESIQTKRFTEWDNAFALDGFFDLWPKAYGNLRLQIASDADILPRWDGYAELFQGFGEGWEISGSFRHMDYSNNNVDLYGIGLGKYIGDWYLRGKTTLSTESGSLDASQSFLIRRFIVSEDHFLQVMAGFGDEVVTLDAGPRVETRSTHFFSTGGQTFLTRNFGIFLNLNYQDIENAPIRRGLEAGLMIRW